MNFPGVFNGFAEEMASIQDEDEAFNDLTPKAHSILRQMLRVEYEFYDYLEKRFSQQTKIL